MLKILQFLKGIIMGGERETVVDKPKEEVKQAQQPMLVDIESTKAKAKSTFMMITIS
jgi:hypothetical protein